MRKLTLLLSLHGDAVLARGDRPSGGGAGSRGRLRTRAGRRGPDAARAGGHWMRIVCTDTGHTIAPISGDAWQIIDDAHLTDDSMARSRSARDPIRNRHNGFPTVVPIVSSQRCSLKAVGRMVEERVFSAGCADSAAASRGQYSLICAKPNGNQLSAYSRTWRG
jgi:hypothetical protein